MKSLKKEDRIKLRKALAFVYRDREKAPVEMLWQLRVMDRIRSMGPFHPKTSHLDLFQRFVWRLAPATCVLVLLLGAAVVQFDFISEYEMVKMLVEDPADFSLLALFSPL